MRIPHDDCDAAPSISEVSSEPDFVSARSPEGIRTSLFSVVSLGSCVQLEMSSCLVKRIASLEKTTVAILRVVVGRSMAILFETHAHYLSSFSHLLAGRVDRRLVYCS